MKMFSIRVCMLIWRTEKDLRNIADSMDHALIIERNSLKETTFEALKARISKLLNLISDRQRRIWPSIL